MRLGKKLSLLLAAAAISVVPAFAQEDEVVIPAGDNILLGNATSLSGDTAPFGIDITRGIELAIEDRPTVTIDGVEFGFEIDSQDELCSAEGGQAVANRFVVDENIVGVIGHMCSSSCNAAAPIYDAAGFTTISPSCTAPGLVERDYTSFNRVVAPDGIQGVLAADYIYNELGVTKIATLHDGSDYGDGLVAVVIPAFEALGGEVVASDAINVGDTDFRALLEGFASAGPELIYFVGFPAEGSLLIQQFADAGLEDVYFMSADGLVGPEYINLAGEVSEGTIASASIPTESDALDAFVARYEETYNETPPGPYHVNAYDAFNVFANAIEAVGTLNEDGDLVISRAALAEYVRSFTGHEGLTGVLNADGFGDTSSAAIGFYFVKDGVFELDLILESGAGADKEAVEETEEVEEEETEEDAA
jgi:branched-chain amino acid transport system substrate-binding protein